MIDKRLLIISSYPILSPQHGGQKRALAEFEYYKTICKYVKFVAVFHRAYYANYSHEDILLGQPDIIDELDKNPYSAEMIGGKAIDKDIHVRSRMAKLLMEYKPDIIQIEQMYSYKGLEVLLRELSMRPRIIMSSQTVEYRMKEEILDGFNITKKKKKKLISEVKKLEERLCKKADVVFAVTKEDAAALKMLGAKKCVVVPNGINRVFATKSSRLYWRNFKIKQNIKQNILFIGSGHPPNWTGYNEIVGDDSSFLPKGAKILLGGGISEYFRQKYPQTSSFWDNSIPLGYLEEDRLAGLLEESDIIILPITSGGGSNLKTAEAILSGKKIVATSYAFRGFEEYKDLPNIYLGDNSNDFKKQIARAIKQPVEARTRQQQILASHVQWKYALAPIEKEFKILGKLGERSRKGQVVTSIARKFRAVARVN